jgi:hypothetical protein
VRHPSRSCKLKDYLSDPEPPWGRGASGASSRGSFGARRRGGGVVRDRAKAGSWPPSAPRSWPGTQSWTRSWAMDGGSGDPRPGQYRGTPPAAGHAGRTKARPPAWRHGVGVGVVHGPRHRLRGTRGRPDVTYRRDLSRGVPSPRVQIRRRGRGGVASWPGSRWYRAAPESMGRATFDVGSPHRRRRTVIPGVDSSGEPAVEDPADRGGLDRGRLGGMPGWPTCA